MTRKVALTTSLKAAVPDSGLYDSDPVSKIDMEHAHDCADHFGKCRIEELEDMKQGNSCACVH